MSGCKPPVHAGVPRGTVAQQIIIPLAGAPVWRTLPGLIAQTTPSSVATTTTKNIVAPRHPPASAAAATGRMRMRSGPAGFFAATLAAAMLASGPAPAQKQGGTLKYYHRDNPPTASIHEEATVSTVNPFMAVFNNLVLFDQGKPSKAWTRSCRTWRKAGPGAPTRRKSPSSCGRASNGTTASRSRRRTSAAPSTCCSARPRTACGSIRARSGTTTSRT